MTERKPTKRRLNDMPLAQVAGILSNDMQFRAFAGTRTIKTGVELGPSAAAEFIRTFCGITSRRDLNTNAIAADKFQTLRTEFDAWAGRIQSPR